MGSKNEHKNSNEVAPYRELQLLTEVVSKPEVTQRELSQKVGIALGLTNIMLRNLVKKGYLRATKSGWKRWLYTLTPDGITHKIQLTASYVTRVLDHYKRVRSILMERLESIPLNKESRIAICGTGELAELIYLTLKEIGVDEIEIFERDPEPDSNFLGMKVRDVSVIKSEDFDRIVVASLYGENSASQSFKADVRATDKIVTFVGYGVAKEVK